jgi:hypothetical protein
VKEDGTKDDAAAERSMPTTQERVMWWGLMDSARHLVKRIPRLCILSLTESYDVVSTIRQSLRCGWSMTAPWTLRCTAQTSTSSSS